MDKKIKLKKAECNSSSEDHKSIDLHCEPVLNQQRVAEWIQSNRTASPIDPVKYAEMENNVKKFLFGESQGEFLKKVAIGKQNYQNLRDIHGVAVGDRNRLNRSHSHTETEI